MKTDQQETLREYPNSGRRYVRTRMEKKELEKEYRFIKTLVPLFIGTVLLVYIGGKTLHKIELKGVPIIEKEVEDRYIIER